MAGTLKKLEFADGADITAPSDITGTVAYSSFYDAQNYTISCSVAANALTIALKNSAGNDPSGASPAVISFRSTTAATGDYTAVSSSAATSLVISSGSTLGQVSGASENIYLYAINNAGTIELAASGATFDESTTQTTTAEGGAGAADSATVLYSTTARTSKAVRLIAVITNTQATAGTWATTPSKIVLTNKPTPNSMIRIDTSNGYGSTGTMVRKFTNVTSTRGNAIVYTSDAINGDTFRVKVPGRYAISYSQSLQNVGVSGISLNASTTTAIDSLSASARLQAVHNTAAATRICFCSWEGYLAAGDIIRAQNDGTSGGGTDRDQFTITHCSFD